MPKVSVIIPNYNREQFIGITIQNFLSQTLTPMEIIVVDDGSTDHSLDVIRSFGPQVTLICQKHEGQSAAKNIGLAAAKGDYIQFFDSDDLCSLNKLEAQASALDKTGADIAYSPWAKVHIEGMRLNFEDHVLQQKSLPSNKNPFHWIWRDWVLALPATMIRRSIIKKVGGYRTDLLVTEDVEFFFRLSLLNPRYQFVPDALMLYRIHALDQLTSTAMSEPLRVASWLKCLQGIEALLLKNKEDFNSSDRFMIQYQIWRSAKSVKRFLKENKLDGNNSENSDHWREPVFLMMNLFKRINDRLRFVFRGSRYGKLYSSSGPTELQKRLVKDLGYEFRTG